jgi:hypothetical protein
MHVKIRTVFSGQSHSGDGDDLTRPEEKCEIEFDCQEWYVNDFFFERNVCSVKTTLRIAACLLHDLFNACLYSSSAAQY